MIYFYFHHRQLQKHLVLGGNKGMRTHCLPQFSGFKDNIELLEMLLKNNCIKYAVFLKSLSFCQLKILFFIRKSLFPAITSNNWGTSGPWGIGNDFEKQSIKVYIWQQKLATKRIYRRSCHLLCNFSSQASFSEKKWHEPIKFPESNYVNNSKVHK